MKIKEIKIENFGKLSGFDLKLDGGITSVNKENGWGKSTLVSFIKVMFFGFDGERVRNDLENERKRFKPWQGGTYGGAIVFEAGGKEYRVIRTFGSGAKDDEFYLYDNKTGLASSDFTADIGQELFRLDAESFRRTVLIGQNDIATSSTDSINAKLGNLSGATDDINNYEEVAEKLRKKINSLSSTRATGELYKRKNEISGLESDIRKLPGVDFNISIVGEKLEEKKRLLSDAKEKSRILSEELSRASACAEFRLSGEEEAYLSAKASAFVTGIPSFEDLEECAQDAVGLNEKERLYASLQFSEEERRDYERLSEKYHGKSGIDEKAEQLINTYSDAKAKKEAMHTKEALLEGYTINNAPPAKSSPAWAILLAVGILLLGVGTAIFLMVSKWPGIAAGCAGLICMGIGIALKVSLGKSQAPAQDNSAFEMLKKEIEGERKFIADSEAGARLFLSDLGMPFESISAISALAEIKNEYKRYMSLYAKEEDQRDDRLLTEISAVKDKLDSFLAPYYTLFNGEDYSTRIKILSYEASRYVSIRDKRDKFVKLMDDYRRSGQPVTELRPVDEIQRDLGLLSFERDRLTGEINDLNLQLSQLLEERDTLNEKAEQLSLQREQLKALSKRAELIARTRELLETAKTSFTSKYSAPVANGFKKYYELLEETDGGRYSFDANMDLMIEDHGSYKDIRLYSAGSQDKIGICFRMGLIEAMYSGEKPMLIMDDPFTNLDEKRLEGCKRILDALKNDYQIIYLTCHESRIPS